jgi:hypothetical protein
MGAYRILFVALAIVAAAMFLGGAAKAPPVTLTGVVEFHLGNPAEGGLFDPTGYLLTGQRDYEPLYLRLHGSLTDPEIASFANSRVEVSGWPMYYSYPAINPVIGQETTSYWILDVTSIKLLAVAPSNE